MTYLILPSKSYFIWFSSQKIITPRKINIGKNIFFRSGERRPRLKKFQGANMDRVQQ